MRTIIKQSGLFVLSGTLKVIFHEEVRSVSRVRQRQYSLSCSCRLCANAPSSSTAKHWHTETEHSNSSATKQQSHSVHKSSVRQREQLLHHVSRGMCGGPRETRSLATTYVHRRLVEMYRIHLCVWCKARGFSSELCLALHPTIL